SHEVTRFAKKLSNAPACRICYTHDEPGAISNATSYPNFFSRSHSRCDSRLRWCWQRDPNARAQGRLQRLVTVAFPREQTALGFGEEAQKIQSKAFQARIPRKT